MGVAEASSYVPHEGQSAPIPKCKRISALRDVLARDGPARKG